MLKFGNNMNDAETIKDFVSVVNYFSDYAKELQELLVESITIMQDSEDSETVTNAERILEKYQLVSKIYMKILEN